MLRYLLCLFALAATAHASTIDNFTFTTAGHTLTFSLPALIPDYYPPGYPPPGPHVGIDNYFTSAAGSIDGVAGHTFGLDFLTQAGAMFRLGFILTPNAGTAPNYKVSGPILVAGPLTDSPSAPSTTPTPFPVPATRPRSSQAPTPSPSPSRSPPPPSPEPFCSCSPAPPRPSRCSVAASPSPDPHPRAKQKGPEHLLRAFSFTSDMSPPARFSPNRF